MKGYENSSRPLGHLSMPDWIVKMKTQKQYFASLRLLSRDPLHQWKWPRRPPEHISKVRIIPSWHIHLIWSTLNFLTPKQHISSMSIRCILSLIVRNSSRKRWVMTCSTICLPTQLSQLFITPYLLWELNTQKGDLLTPVKVNLGNCTKLLWGSFQTFSFLGNLWWIYRWDLLMSQYTNKRADKIQALTAMVWWGITPRLCSDTNSSQCIFAQNLSCIQIEQTLISEAARMAGALGFNRATMNDSAHRTFWVVYILDKTFSFFASISSVSSSFVMLTWMVD